MSLQPIQKPATLCRGRAAVERYASAVVAKARVEASGSITFFTGKDLPVFLITVFGKGEQANLSKAERNDLAKLSKHLVAAYQDKMGARHS